MRILSVEPNELMGQYLHNLLSREGFDVERVTCGEDALDLAREYEFSVILCELNLPDLHGYDLLRALRRAQVNTPVIILTSVDDKQAKLTAFGNGADDYVTKPCDGPELVARLRALVRRSAGLPSSVVRIGGLAINLDNKEVSLHGLRVDLTGKEYSVLEALALKNGKTVGKNVLLDWMYGSMDEPVSKVIDVYVCRLRKKLDGDETGESYIRTVRGLGYALHNPEAELRLAA